MRILHDDLGARVDLPDRVVRAVSLVPSLTEAIAETCPDRLVGATDWCTHPADLHVRRVRGTKNPDRSAIAELRPDLVVANKEENRELDVNRLRDSGIAVWVTDIETVDQALASMRRLFGEAFEVDPSWLAQAERGFAARQDHTTQRAVVPIWRDPWMVVGRPTYTADLLGRLGFEVATPAEGRYPHVELAAIDDPRLADVVLLPDEPYVFTEQDGPEAFTRVPTRRVSGRAITWYGPAMLDALATF